MTDLQLQRIQILAVLLEKYARYGIRADEGREIFIKSVLETIAEINNEIK